MANLQSSKKNIRKIAKLTAHNRQVKSKLKTLSKKVAAAAAQSPAAAAQAASALVSALDKAAKTGIIHPNKASRHKQALSRYVFAPAA
jgi:small subunit ribosomal protein S20